MNITCFIKNVGLSSHMWSGMVKWHDTVTRWRTNEWSDLSLSFKPILTTAWRLKCRLIWLDILYIGGRMKKRRMGKWYVCGSSAQMLQQYKIFHSWPTKEHSPCCVLSDEERIKTSLLGVKGDTLNSLAHYVFTCWTTGFLHTVLSVNGASITCYMTCCVSILQRPDVNMISMYISINQY